MTELESAAPKLIVIDWGTTSLRAALIDATGSKIDSVETEAGIQFLFDGDYESHLLHTVDPWFSKYGDLPLVLLGMVTSRNGWVEVPYVKCPASAQDLARGAIKRRLSNGSLVVLLPGIIDMSGKPFPEVMRGEETQIVGIGLGESKVLVLPGTHSKWTRVFKQRIDRFQTFITGELFALLTRHSFIAQGENEWDASTNWTAFDAGVRAASNDSVSDYSLLSLLFSARTGLLAEQLGPNDIHPFVSGLLIAHEFCSAQQCGWFDRTDTIVIVGNDELNNRYSRAANVLGLCVQPGPRDAALIGALKISTDAGLLH